MGKRSAQGSGTIRKKTVTRNGKQYTYWEARVTTGRDPGTGRQIQRSFTGQSQKEVLEKMQAAAVAVSSGTYTPPTQFSLGEWLDTWSSDYLGGMKPASLTVYRGNIKNHIKPALGAVRLDRLRPHMIQRFINSMELSPSSVRLAYKVLHQGLEKAVQLGYIPSNPSSGCELPRMDQKEIRPLEDQEVSALLDAARGHELEYFITVALWTGCRLSELLGLTWDSIDWKRRQITINKQLTRSTHRDSGLFITPKSGKSRTISPAQSVLDALKAQQRRQAAQRLRAGPAWNNAPDLVFTSDIGAPLYHTKIDEAFKRLIQTAGLRDGIRFHDLRHTYAVDAIRAGDDIKTVQENLGHATAAFTLDRYAHVSSQMQQDSAARMDQFIANLKRN